MLLSQLHGATWRVFAHLLIFLEATLFWMLHQLILPKKMLPEEKQSQGWLIWLDFLQS